MCSDMLPKSYLKLIKYNKVKQNSKRKKTEYDWHIFFSILKYLFIYLAAIESLRASLVAQMVKNPPTVWETWVQSLGWEDSLEEGMATHCSIAAWRIPTDRGAWQASVHRVCKESDMPE